MWEGKYGPRKLISVAEITPAEHLVGRLLGRSREAGPVGVPEAAQLHPHQGLISSSVQ